MGLNRPEWFVDETRHEADEWCERARHLLERESAVRAIAWTC